MLVLEFVKGLEAMSVVDSLMADCLSVFVLRRDFQLFEMATIRCWFLLLGLIYSILYFLVSISNLLFLVNICPTIIVAETT